MQKRILSMLLSMTMLFGLIPISAAAEEEDSGEVIVQEIKEKMEETETVGEQVQEPGIALFSSSDTQTESSVVEVKIGEEVKYYDDILEAFSDAQQGTSESLPAEMKLLKNVEVTPGDT